MSENKTEVKNQEQSESKNKGSDVSHEAGGREEVVSNKHHFSVRESLLDFAGIAAVGFILAALTPLVAQANGHDNEALNNLVKHVLTIESDVFAFAGAIAGLCLIFRSDGFAEVLWKHFCASFLGFAAHGAALATGLLLGLLIPIGLNVTGLPTNSPGKASGTAAFALILFIVVFFFYIGFKGYYKQITPKFTKRWFVSKPCGIAIMLVSIKFLFHFKFYGL